MTGPCPADVTDIASADGGRTRFLPGMAQGLHLAAAPAFAAMALLTATAGGGASDGLCAAAPDASPLTGMVPMYVLMSAVHAAPWLRLMSR